MTPIDAMRQAREALVESVELVQQDYDSDWRHGMPTREGQLRAKLGALDAHKAAIASLDAAIAEAEQVQPTTDGCPHCSHPLYAATKCRVCGRVTDVAEQVQPVAWIGPDKQTLADELYCPFASLYPDRAVGFAPLYTNPAPQRPAPTDDELRAMLPDAAGLLWAGQSPIDVWSESQMLAFARRVLAEWGGVK